MDEQQVPHRARPRKLASVLASSTSEAPLAIGGDPEHKRRSYEFPAWLLLRLLQKYSGGKIWTFDDDEDAAVDLDKDDIIQ